MDDLLSDQVLGEKRLVCLNDSSANRFLNFDTLEK
jgi:hypothetical protein